MAHKTHLSFEPGKLFTAREAIAYLRISLSTLHRMEQRGQLHALRTPGGHRRYTLEMLNRCLETPDRFDPAGLNHRLLDIEEMEQR